MGVPPVVIHLFIGVFHFKESSALGDPHGSELETVMIHSHTVDG